MVYQPKTPVGYKRATTKEYVQFLGFSRGSLEELKGDFEELKREGKEGLRWEEKGNIRERCFREIGAVQGGEMRGRILKEIEGLLDLIYGEDCMMGRQIASLEKKMIEEKTLPGSEMITRVWKTSACGDKKFWGLVETRFGLIRGEKGVVRRDEKSAVRRDDKSE